MSYSYHFQKLSFNFRIFSYFQVLKAMKESDSPCPAIFAMSNPTTKGLPLIFSF
jgi:malic enzyme